MTRPLRAKYVVALLVAFSMLVTACGDDDDAATTTVPPLTTTTAAATTTTVQTFDLVEAANSYLSAIPEGFMAMGDLTAFKDAMTVGNPVVIDVREASEYAEGHIPGAINIPLRTLGDNLDKIPTDRQVFVYCASGYRAALGTSSLRMLGYDNVLSFPPSYKGWTAAGETVSMDVVSAENFAMPTIQPQLLASVQGFLTGLPEGFLAMGDLTVVQESIDAGAFLLDVRQPSEFADGHLPGAVNIPLRDLAANLDQIPTDQQVIVYCKSGHRAAVAGAALNTLGLSNVRVFPPSYNGWVEAGLPVQTT